MKYNVLADYKRFLINDLHLRPSTAQTYFSSLDNLLKGQSLFNSLDVDMVIKKLSEIKYKNYFSKSKNAFLHFLKFQNITLTSEQINKIKKIEIGTKKKYKKLQEVDFKKVEITIQQLKNEKLKLCYYVLLETGLRVSELSQIKKEDTNISESKILLSFISKGGKQEQVSIVKKENKQLYEMLKELIEKTEKNEKVFYSAGYLQNEATKHGFTCHDLRRACAKIEYKKTRSKQAVKKKLRHSNMKTTNIYLRSKIKF